MLKVKTTLGLSEVKGIGLFAAQDIKKGTVVGINNDTFTIIRFTEKEWHEMESNVSPESFEQIKMRAYKNRGDGLYWKNLDDTSFINHSKDPNIEFKGDVDVALRDIKEGEELFIDYTTFYDDQYFEEIMNL